MLRNSPEERRSHLLRDRSLHSHTYESVSQVIFLGGREFREVKIITVPEIKSVTRQNLLLLPFFQLLDDDTNLVEHDKVGEGTTNLFSSFIIHVIFALGFDLPH
jgi:hypothetical protein